MNLRGGMNGSGSSWGFTRVDLVVVLSVVCLGVALANPIFISPLSPARQRADALVCQDNLGQIGRAFQIWATDHEDRHPWFISTNEGGLRGHQLAPNTFMNFAWVSNTMPNASILVCPADTNTIRRAKDFSTNPDGGFMHPNYRANALSYLISFHAQHHLPGSILSGDRNLNGTQEAGCSMVPFMTRLAGSVVVGGPPAVSWAETIHSQKGNILFNDGSADFGGSEVISAGLRVQVNWRTHLQFPR